MLLTYYIKEIRRKNKYINKIYSLTGNKRWDLERTNSWYTANSEIFSSDMKTNI
jgi:hypothetical protein